MYATIATILALLPALTTLFSVLVTLAVMALMFRAADASQAWESAFPGEGDTWALDLDSELMLDEALESLEMHIASRVGGPRPRPQGPRRSAGAFAFYLDNAPPRRTPRAKVQRRVHGKQGACHAMTREACHAKDGVFGVLDSPVPGAQPRGIVQDTHRRHPHVGSTGPPSPSGG